jgi:4-carboxymuconolactone decarboxylase
MDVDTLYQRGLRLRKELFGDETVEARMKALGEFGAPLQNIINSYAYGDIWNRPGLARKTRSLVMLAMMAAMCRPAELELHIKGALANGCTQEEIREVLLQVAIYCGIPASLEAHRVALEVFAAAPAAKEAPSRG